MRAFHEVRSYNSDFMVWHSSYDNISFLAHWHKEIELIYVRSGTCHLSITDVNFTAHAGDLAICESGAIHYSDRSEEHTSELQSHLNLVCITAILTIWTIPWILLFLTPLLSAPFFKILISLILWSQRRSWSSTDCLLL